MQDIEDQGQNDESSTDPLGGLCKLSIEALGIAAGEESIRTAAANAVRQTRVLAGLEENSQNNSQTAQELKNRDKNDNELHDL